jgi:hypothetical protein
LVCKYLRFGKTYYFGLQERKNILKKEAKCSSETVLSAKPHAVTLQKAVIVCFYNSQPSISVRVEMNFDFITPDAGSKRRSHHSTASDIRRQQRSLHYNSTTFNAGGAEINLQQRQRQQVFPSSLLFDLLSVEIRPNSLSTLLFPFLPPQTEQINIFSLLFGNTVNVNFNVLHCTESDQTNVRLGGKYDRHGI